MICRLCKLVIKEKDNYVRITDFQQGEFFMEGFYHNKCYHQALKSGKEMSVMKNMAFNLMKRTGVMLDEAGVGNPEEKEKVFVIK